MRLAFAVLRVAITCAVLVALSDCRADRPAKPAKAVQPVQVLHLDLRAAMLQTQLDDAHGQITALTAINHELRRQLVAKEEPCRSVRVSTYTATAQQTSSSMATSARTAKLADTSSLLPAADSPNDNAKALLRLQKALKDDPHGAELHAVVEDLLATDGRADVLRCVEPQAKSGDLGLLECLEARWITPSSIPSSSTQSNAMASALAPIIVSAASTRPVVKEGSADSAPLAIAPSLQSSAPPHRIGPLGRDLRVYADCQVTTDCAIWIDRTLVPIGANFVVVWGESGASAYGVSEDATTGLVPIPQNDWNGIPYLVSNFARRFEIAWYTQVAIPPLVAGRSMSIWNAPQSDGSQVWYATDAGPTHVWGNDATDEQIAIPPTFGLPPAPPPPPPVVTCSSAPPWDQVTSGAIPSDAALAAPPWCFPSNALKCVATPGQPLSWIVPVQHSCAPYGMNSAGVLP